MFDVAPNLDGSGLRVAVLASRFNPDLVERLVAGAERQLDQLRAELVETHWVPGAFEIPLAAQALVTTGRYDAVVCLGVVIRGDTPHFDYVCRAVTDGVRDVNLRAGVPVAFGVLTTENREQALVRAAHPGESGTNKGGEAALVAVEMACFLRNLRGGTAEAQQGSRARVQHA